jgi:hypothetical protein
MAGGASMQLKTEDGKLTLGSAYKMIVWGWLLSWSALVIPILLIITVGALLSGQMNVNGEMVYGVGPVFMSILPFFVMMPIIVVMQAFMFGAFLTFGLWLYRHWRPLSVDPA